MAYSGKQQSEEQRRLPIADLEPSLGTHHTSIIGVVTLIWPYSSSNKTLSLLLVEPDFRLRRQRGQVRIHFKGSSATAVANSGISIGAEVSLSLVGVQWAKDESTPRTPGNGVEWELRFEERLAIQIECEAKEPILLDIDHPTPSPTPPHTPSSLSVFTFPKLHPELARGPETWSSPAFLKRSRLSANRFNLQYDPFQEEPGFEESNRRKRTKFGRESGQWRFAERTPSPEKEFHIRTPSADEQPAAAIEKEEKVNAALSPESLSSEQGRSNEVTHTVKDQSVSSGRSSERLEEVNTTLERGEDAPGEIPQITSEAQIEPSALNIGAPEEEHEDDSGSKSPFEEAIESPKPPQTTMEDLGEDGRMIPGRLENQQTPFAPTSPNVSETSVVDLAESASADELEATTLAILSSTPEFLESVESPDVLSVREVSIEPTSSNDDPSEVERDEEFSGSDSDLLVSSDGGPESPIVVDRVESESEDRMLLNTEEHQESPESGHPPVVDAGSSKELSRFGLDGSTFSQIRSSLTPSPVSLINEGVETTNIQSNSVHESEQVDDIPPSHSQSEGAEAAAVDYADIVSNEAPGRKQSLELEVTTKIEESTMKHDAAEAEETDSEEADTPHPEEIVAASSAHFERQPFDARPRPYEGNDTCRVEEDMFCRDAAQGLVQDHVNGVPLVPSPDSPEAFSTDVQSAKTADVAETEEESRISVAVMHNQEAVMETSRSVLTSTSKVEIIDLGSEDDEDHAAGDIQLEIEIQSTLQEADLTMEGNVDHGTISMGHLEEPSHMITQNADHRTPAAAEGGDTSDSLPAQIDNTPPLEESDISNAEYNKPQTEITEGKGSPNSIIATPRSANYDRIAINAVTDKSNVKDEALHSTDDEFPDILDLFAASRNSITADGKAAEMDQSSHEKTSHPPILADEAESKIEVLMEEDRKEENRENVKEGAWEMVPAAATKFQTQLLTPNATQQTQLLSQESSLSLQRLGETGDLPTPRLTQSASATSVISTTPKRPSFVEKLKELRSLSAKSPRTRRSTNAASPWFEPKRSSQIIPNTDSDSVDSEDPVRQVVSEDEDRPTDRLSVTPVLPSLRQSTRLHKTLPTAPQPTLQPGFRTTLSYFAPLSTLSSHFNTPTDVLTTIVSSTTITRAKTGPKDFHQSLYITDPSSASSHPPITTARIFRPHKTAFPEVQRGDAILLRNFKVQSQAKQLMLLSTDSSAWAVFRKGAEVQMKGPPVEFAAEERGFVRGLWGWWTSLSSQEWDALEAAVPKEKGKGKAKEVAGGRGKATPSPRKTRAAVRHELRDGTTYADATADEEEDHDDHQKRGGSRETGTPSLRRTRAVVGHELRDGTTYTDGRLAGKYGVHALRDGTRYRDEAG